MPVSPSAPDVEQAPVPKSTYGQILRSTALVGGSSVVNLAIGILRAKTMALILGKSGVGLNGLYGSISNLAEALVGMGINSSGVRQIAEAVGTGDATRIAKAAAVLRRVSLGLGVGGALLLAAFSRQISILTFENDGQTLAVCFLALGLLFRLISAGQGALLQGIRRISDVAKIGVLSAFFGTVITIPLVYFLKERGVALSLAASSGVALLISWWISRNAVPAATAVSVAEVRHEALDLLKLGTAFMASALLMMGGAYVIRAIVFKQLGLEATGLYQAAWSLGGLYTNFILQAMGSDFYPRLSAVASDDGECNRLVNEQAKVSLLLAGTGIIATISFAPIVVNLFYDSGFSSAVSLLRWICLGTAMQVISWPLGIVVVARNAKALFLWGDSLWTLVHIGLAWFLMPIYGLDGAGMAFFGAYLFHAVFNYIVVARLSGFRWTAGNLEAGAIYLALISVAFGGFFLLPFVWAVSLGLGMALLSGAYSLRALVTLVSPASIPVSLRRLLAGMGLLPSVVPGT
ncbi:MAG: O-antigen translocase [Bryobacteraceae bacterium]